MNKNVRAIVAFDEAVTLRAIERLDRALKHYAQHAIHFMFTDLHLFHRRFAHPVLVSLRDGLHQYACQAVQS